jgi:hypothetical protein
MATWLNDLIRRIVDNRKPGRVPVSRFIQNRRVSVEIYGKVGHLYVDKKDGVYLLLRVPEIMATTIPETLACLKEGQNGGIVAEEAGEDAFRATRTVRFGQERLC